MSHQSSLPEPEVFQNRAVPEPEVFQNRAVPEPEVFQNRAPEVFHIYGKVLSSSYCQRLIARYLPQTTLIEDPSYSVYLRFDFTSGDIGDVTGELGPLKNYLTKRRQLKLGNRWFFTSYETGGFIKLHQAGHSMINGQPSEYTVLIYLNDDYTGGELVLPTLNMSIRPPAGTVLIMDQTTYHYVNKVLSGKKHLLRIDAIR